MKWMKRPSQRCSWSGLDPINGLDEELGKDESEGSDDPSDMMSSCFVIHLMK